MQTSEQTARHRLRVATGEPAVAPGPPDPPLPDPPAPGARRARWLPASWRGARTDPGRRGALALGGVAAAAAVLAAVGVWRERPVPQPVPALPVVAAAVAPTLSAPAPTTPAPTTELVVSVAGAVARPGLVTLAPGARVADALAAAGGAVPGTDLLTLNLAQPLADGEQVLVGVPGPPVSGGGSAPAGGAAEGAAPGGLVDLNTATLAELEELPGVGPVMAQAILDHRTERGGFTDVAELNDVSGVGEARFAQLEALVRV